jgi:DNA-binding transcriptional ArsR family regulator
MGGTAPWVGPDISAVGALLGDPARASILASLAGGIALPAGQLAERARVKPATASFHLSKLVEAGWLAVERHGRHRYYRLCSIEIAELIEAIACTAPPRPLTSLRTHRQQRALTAARTCFDHLAGRLGVAVTNAMVDEGTLARTDGMLALTMRGRVTLRERGIDVSLAEKGRRPLVRACLDWTERQHHVAGALGAAILTRWLRQGVVERQADGRAIRVTDVGRSVLATWSVSWPASAA